MNCKQVQQNIDAYVDQELTGSKSLVLRQHLSQCNDCQAVYRASMKLKSVLSNLAEPAEPADDFEERLLRAIRTADKPIYKRPVGMVLAGVAAASFFITVAVMQSSKVAATQQVATQQQDAISRAVQSDQLMFSGSDPLSGARGVTMAGYAK